MKKASWGIVFASILSLLGVTLAGTPAAWFLEEIEALTGGSGRWVTDNSAYRSEQEPYDAYGMEWTSSFDGTTMRGRLFGLRDGIETADFWEFRQYWDPETDEPVLAQFGWGGAVGIGKAWRDGDATRSDQTFHTPGSPSRRVGHRSSFPTKDTHVTESFDIDGDEWKPNRSYTWKRVPIQDE